jgi:hypothetical protein
MTCEDPGPVPDRAAADPSTIALFWRSAGRENRVTRHPAGQIAGKDAEDLGATTGASTDTAAAPRRPQCSRHHREATRVRFDPIESNPTVPLAVSISRHRSASE